MKWRRNNNEKGDWQKKKAAKNYGEMARAEI